MRQASKGFVSTKGFSSKVVVKLLGMPRVCVARTGPMGGLYGGGVAAVIGGAATCCLKLEATRHDNPSGG